MLRRYWRFTAQIALVAVVYFLAARLGLLLAFEQANTSPVWPPTGIAIAAVLYYRYRIWPGIFLGALAVNLFVGTSFWVGFCIAIGNTLEAIVAGYFILRYTGAWPFSKISDTTKFLVIVVAATAISATVGIGTLYFSGSIGGESILLLWNTWWLGDLVGALVVTPFLLTWLHAKPHRYSVATIVEAAFTLLGTASILFVIFIQPVSLNQNHHLIFFLLPPILVWSSLRFHHMGATFPVLLVSITAIYGTINGNGPFVLSGENESLLVLQASIGTVMLTLLLLISIQEERIKVNRDLRKAQNNLESLISERTAKLEATNELLETEMQQQRLLADALQLLLRVIDLSANESFFVRCVEGLSIAFKTPYAFIGVISDDSKTAIQTIAVWADGRPGANFTYNLAGTPCQDVLTESMELVSEKAAERYPDDGMLISMGVESYFGAPLKSSSGEVLGIIAVMNTEPMSIESWLQPLLGLFSNRVSTEIQRRAATNELELAASVFKESTEGIVICDANTNIIRVNPEFTRITGYTLQEVVGKKPMTWKSGVHNKSFYQKLWHALTNKGIWQGEIHNKRKNGEMFISSQVIKAVKDSSGKIHQYISIINDITEQKNAEKRIYNLAHNDAITQLPNRASFHTKLHEAIARAQRSSKKLAVMFIDLDHFKLINDTSGHPVGDELLQQVAERLQGVIGHKNLISRFGGDEFTVMLPFIDSIEFAADIARKILKSLEAPFSLTSCEITIGASIGIGIYPDNGDDVSVLLRCADNAMYKAKEGGRCAFEFYTEQMHTVTQERVELERELRDALKNEEFVIHYQPQIDLKTQMVTGVEALVRWMHPDKGLIAPDRFIAVAEATGLIVPIGNWVIKEACHQLARWQAEGLNHFNLAINMSARQFFQQNLLRTIEEVIQSSGIRPSDLEFEITESMMMSNIEETIETLHKIKKLGVQLSIDDFGTGYSSLSYLKRFPLNKLKIDRSFVQGLPDELDDIAIVEATIAIAHALKLTVIAEGVETKEQLTFLRQHNCNEIQGYYYSKPLAKDELSDYLSSISPFISTSTMK